MLVLIYLLFIYLFNCLFVYLFIYLFSGYGETGLGKMDTGDPIDFMKSLLDVLNIPHPIIVSPSRSGDLTVPLIIECPDLVRGYVPVSPHSTDKYGAERYRQSQVRKDFARGVFKLKFY